jgi:hypothetical protein
MGGRPWYQLWLVAHWLGLRDESIRLMGDRGSIMLDIDVACNRHRRCAYITVEAKLILRIGARIKRSLRDYGIFVFTL